MGAVARVVAVEGAAARAVAVVGAVARGAAVSAAVRRPTLAEDRAALADAQATLARGDPLRPAGGR